MNGQTVILRGVSQRDFAKHLIDRAPADAVVNIRAATRSSDQNAKMHAMLSDISRSKPLGRLHTPDDWKAILMHACGWECQFQAGLDGRPFPIGFRSSKLTKEQMGNLIEYMYSFGAENNVVWSEELKACA